MTTTKPRLSPVDFYEQEVKPAVFESLDRVFPEFGWKRTTSGGWRATNREATKTSTFGDVRPGRVVCNRPGPGGFLVHGGPMVDWLEYRTGKKLHEKDFVQAVKDLAALAGVDTSALDRPETPEQREKRERREHHRALLDKFVDQARDALLGEAGGDARTYLVADRGFDKNKLKDLPFGLFTTGEDVETHLVGNGFLEADVRASGLLADTRWTNRLILPWRDARGHVATIAARCLDGSEPKYLYLQGGKKPSAFGLDVALWDRPNELVLVEGLVDSVSLQTRGLRHVASLGGSLDLLTVDRWKALQDLGPRRFILASDADEAGRNGLLKALENARNVQNIPEVYVVDPADLGDAKDPDEFVRQRGLDAFREVLGRRKPAAVYEAEVLLAGVTPDSPDHKRRDAVGRVLELEASLKDRDVLDRDDILKVTADATGYDVEALLSLAEAQAAKRREERARAELKGILRDAHRDLQEGRPAADVASETLAGLNARGQALSAEPPPTFSVDRLKQESQATPEGKRSGWAALDNEGVCFNAGELALLAGRTGHGKTSVLMSLCVNWLVAGGDELLVVYSHEEPEVRIFLRLLSLLTAKKPNESWTAAEAQSYLRSPKAPNPGHASGTWPSPKALTEAQDRLRSWEDHLLVVHRPDWSVDDLAVHARGMAETRTVGAVLVDYLQRVPPPRPMKGSRWDRRDQEVSAVGRTLKALAVDLACPVVAGAQINRESVPKEYERKVSEAGNYEAATKVIRTARPGLHHLREGGSEQEADLVLGLLNYAADYRTESVAEHLPPLTILEIGPLKNRYEAVGRWASLGFEGRFGLVRDATDLELTS